MTDENVDTIFVMLDVVDSGKNTKRKKKRENDRRRKKKPGRKKGQAFAIYSVIALREKCINNTTQTVIIHYF